MDRNALRIGLVVLGVGLASLIGCSLIVDSQEWSDVETVPSSPLDQPAAVASHVILISVDGLRPDAIDVLGISGAPALHRIRSEGATTDNARTDYDYTLTLPNHTSQLTGRGVLGKHGHRWEWNGDPEPGQTLHSNKRSYVSSVFDVVDGAGHRTVLFAGKSKFSLFETSYGDPENTSTTSHVMALRPLHRFVHDGATRSLVDSFIVDMTTARFGFGFLHLGDPDARGHRSGWDVTPGSPYLETVRDMDGMIESVLRAIEGDPALKGRVTVIVTSDHGGHGTDHGDPTEPFNYTIPFYVWGAGVGSGVDLYELNDQYRIDPGTRRPAYEERLQPVRNGDAANLALRLLGLESVPGSTINPESAPLLVRAR
jgi:predicted AlkP superfamily pyrophosphatase or phosphodiesterase